MDGEASIPLGGFEFLTDFLQSYGGHYGPAFFNYFYEQNQLIENGTISGVALNMNTMGFFNGIVDEYIQAPLYVLRNLIY